MTRLSHDFSKSIKSCIPIRREEEGGSQLFLSQSSSTSNSIQSNKKGELETSFNVLFLLTIKENMIMKIVGLRKNEKCRTKRKMTKTRRKNRNRKNVSLKKYSIDLLTARFSETW